MSLGVLLEFLCEFLALWRSTSLVRPNVPARAAEPSAHLWHVAIAIEVGLRRSRDVKCTGGDLKLKSDSLRMEIVGGSNQNVDVD